MTTPLRPTSRIVTLAWLKLAAPGVGADTALPAVSEATAISGFIRPQIVGGSPDRDVPLRNPVISAECWISPHPVTRKVSWSRAEDLAERLAAAVYDRQLMNRVLDLSEFGNYAPARVLTGLALTEPRRAEGEPTDWARVDVDLQLFWTGG